MKSKLIVDKSIENMYSDVIRTIHDVWIFLGQSVGWRGCICAMGGANRIVKII